MAKAIIESLRRKYTLLLSPYNTYNKDRGDSSLVDGETLLKLAADVNSRFA
jgi:hypothetical protein